MPLARALQTAQRHDYMDAYVDDLPNVVDIARDPRRGDPHRRRPAGRGERRLLGRDRRAAQPRPDGGQPAGRRDVAVHDAGHRRQDPDGLQFAERDGLADRQDRTDYQIATGNDADSDRHGIVTPDGGLMNPNHYLAVAIDYLYTNRPGWPASTRGRQDGGQRRRSSTGWSPGWAASCSRCRSGSNGSSTDWSAAQSVSAARRARARPSCARDGSVWTTDKDGIILALLASEILAVTGRRRRSATPSSPRSTARQRMPASMRPPTASRRRGWPSCRPSR